MFYLAADFEKSLIPGDNNLIRNLFCLCSSQTSLGRMDTTLAFLIVWPKETNRPLMTALRRPPEMSVEERYQLGLAPAWRDGEPSLAFGGRVGSFSAVALYTGKLVERVNSGMLKNKSKYLHTKPALF